MRVRRAIAVLFGLAVAAALPSAPAAGIMATCSVTDTYTVQTTADEQDGPANGGAGPDGKLSLREAIASASHDAQNSTINIPAGTYRLTLGELAPSPTDCDLTVAGAGARRTTIDAGGNSRVMAITSGTRNFAISGVTLTGGAGADGTGGAIDDESPLSLDKVTITGNSARDGGGGIAAAAALTVSSSTISANTASPASTPSVGQGRGGGILADGGLVLSDSTISGNRALAGSGGDGLGGGVYSGGSLDMRSSTLADNSAGGTGGNVSTATGLSENSLFVNGTPNNCDVASLGSNDSGDKSLTSDTTCLSAASQQHKGTPLGPLANNGGPTDTRALLSGNGAINSGDSIACGGDMSSITIDQRGVARPQGSGCDVGAFEFVATASLSLDMTAAPKMVLVGQKVTYTIRVHSHGPAFDATQPTMVDHRPAGTSFVSATPSQGKCTGTATVTCALGTLANGSIATVKVVLKATKAGTLSNTASESAPRPDFSTGDDQATAKVTVKQLPKCSLKGRKKVKSGAVRLTAACDRAAPVQLLGTLKVTPKRKKGKPKPTTTSITLAAVSRSVKANVPLKLKVPLPDAALKSLENGAKESARFRLVAYGKSVAKAKIARLEIVKKSP